MHFPFPEIKTNRIIHTTAFRCYRAGLKPALGESRTIQEARIMVHKMRMIEETYHAALENIEAPSSMDLITF